MAVVAVTGAAGYLGSRLCALLDEHPDTKRVIGIDVVEPRASARNLEFYRLDVRSPELGSVLAGADAIVHLGFHLAGRDAGEMHDVNVGGTRNVLRATAEAGVRKVILTSSVAAYGAHADNDVPLTESSPLRPLPDYPYSAHKAECEELVEDFRREHPDTIVTVFRPAMVCGPHVDGPIGRMLEAPVLLSVDGYEPPLQAVHERDAAAALVYALDHDLDGAYNLCAADWIPQGDLGRLSGKRTVSMGAEDAKRRLELLWQMGVSALPSGFVAFLMHPTVMSNDKLVKAGFEFRYGTREALRDALEARRGWVSVGGMRFRPRMVAVGLAGGAVLAGSVLRGIVRAARRA